MSTITSSSAVTDQEKDKPNNPKLKNSVTSILHRRNVDNGETRTKNKRKQNGVTFATKEDDHSSSSIANNHKRRRNEDISTGIETGNAESNLDMTQDQVRQLKSIRRHQRQHNNNTNNNNGTENLLSDDENEEDKRNSSIHRLSDDQYDDDDDDDDKQKATGRNNHHQRQNQQKNLFVGEDMVVDSRNLSSEENGDTIPIEPFNMENERTDGSGYFDGDTFVFRRNQKDDDDEEEEDAWLENLNDNDKKKNENNDKDKTRSTIHLWNSKNKQQQVQPKRDKKSKIELYQIIDSKLAKDNETVLQAIQRFGSLVAKQNKKKQTQKMKQTKDESSNGHKNNLARESLDILTECAQACLMEYDDHSIYQRPKSFFQNQLSTLVKPKKEMVMGNEQKKVIEWEYMGNADKEQIIIQGPFTTQQMISWIQAGYFVGANAVQVRSITTTTYTQEKKKEDATSKKEKLENMLQDLEDSDDDENKNDDTEHSNSTKVIRGGWLSSDKVSFSSYL